MRSLKKEDDRAGWHCRGNAQHGPASMDSGLRRTGGRCFYSFLTPSDVGDTTEASDGGNRGASEAGIWGMGSKEHALPGEGASKWA